MTKKSSKSKMLEQTALSYGFGKTTLGKILVATSDKGVVFILIDGSNAKLLTGLQRFGREEGWWPLQNSNLRPPLCESGALTKPSVSISPQHFGRPIGLSVG